MGIIFDQALEANVGKVRKVRLSVSSKNESVQCNLINYILVRFGVEVNIHDYCGVCGYYEFNHGGGSAIS